MLRISGEIIDTHISYHDFMVGYDGMRVEWVDGTVVEMASIDERHDDLSRFLDNLFQAYLEASGGGRILQDPMILRVLPGRARAPDLQVLLPDRLHYLGQNEVTGPPNLVVEIVSQGSQRTDRFEKFGEYEEAGIPEYWIIDHLHEESLFYQLDDSGQYVRQEPDPDGIYHSRALPRLALPVDMLWRENLPGLREIVQMVDRMLP